MMKIHYKKRHINMHLFFGIAWLSLAMLAILTEEGIKWIDFTQLGISVVYLSVYFYTLKNQYLTIDDGIIRENRPFGKKIKLSEVKRIKEFAGDYILKTDGGELTING